MRVLRWLGIAIAALLLAFAALIGVARFLDGPLGPLPGGPLRGGVASEEAGDWSFAGDLGTLELEVAGRSRTVWFVTHAGTLYIAAADADRKRWPAEAVADGRVRIRVAGRLYDRALVRIEDETLRRAVGEVFESKYSVELDDAAAARAWIFRVDPRSP